LKLNILPYDECDFSRVLDALESRGFITRYACETEIYGCVPTWKAHQFINNKEPSSLIPKPVQNLIDNALPTCGERVECAIDTRGVKEGKGKEGEMEGKGRETPPPDSGSELMLAGWIFEEACLPADNATRRVVADCIRLLVKQDGGTTQNAAEFILAAVKQGIADGDTISRFWFSDRKYLPQKPKKSARQKRIEEWEPSE
jgi:hypothetical protein